MPLPEGGSSVPWPPPGQEAIDAQYAVWSAWWAGNPETLASLYGSGLAADPVGFFEGQQGAGFKGAVRRITATARRWFWGEKQQTGQPRTRLHTPLAADIATASADLLFSDPPLVRADPDGPGGAKVVASTQARLDEFWRDDTHAVLLEAAEVCSALGGVFLRLVWGPDRDKPWVTAHAPEHVVPEWRWGRLHAATFWREIARDGRRVWRHLERHESGKILHGLYEGEADTLGRVVALTERPETAPLADGPLVNGNEMLTQSPVLTARYVPNMKPNRQWRGVPQAAHLGRPDIAGAEGLLDALDLVVSSLVRDVDLGKARLIVPAEYLQDHGPGQGASVDLDREVYEAVNTMAGEESKIQIEQVQFEIRVDQHNAVHDKLRSMIIQAAGYSEGSFGDKREGGQGVTATEVTAELRRSLMTRAKKIRYWKPELEELLEAWTYVDAAFYQSGITPLRPAVEWPDAVSVDPLQEAQTLRELHTAEAISIEQKVRRLHPEWEDGQVDAEVEKIRKDFGRDQAVEDPGTFTGDGPSGPPPEDPADPEGEPE